MLSRTRFLPLIVALCVTSGCGKDASTKTVSENGESDSSSEAHSAPEKVGAAFAKAMAEKKWDDAIGYVAEDSRWFLVAGALESTDGGTDKVMEILKKHGVKVTKPLSIDEIKKSTKLVEIFVDLMSWIDREMPANSFVKGWRGSRFSDFKTKSDLSTSAWTVNGKLDNDRITYRRIDGRWFLDLAAMRGE